MSESLLSSLKPIIFLAILFWQILKVWWWVLLPVILFSPLKFLYLWYIQDKWYGAIKKILLEIKIPEEVERPFKAMEQVFSNFWTLYDPPNWKEKWLEGHFLLSFSLEIVSIGGKVHFFLRVPKNLRHMFEDPIYSQFPDVEISEVPDYTKEVPQDIPNKDWQLYGWDFINIRDSAYPLKTYSKFFEERPETVEEKRMSPLAVLLEGMADLKEGEQMWLQIIAKPILGEVPWVEDAKKIVAEIVKRPPKPKPKSIIGETVKTLFTGKPPFEEEEKEAPLIPPEMRLTPGEREIVQAIENKISKHGFETNIRVIYLGKKDVFFKPRVKLPLNFSAGISTGDLNSFKPWKETITKVVPPSLFRNRRIYLKSRRIFHRYCQRVPPLYPFKGGTFVLNSEELATLYHFPSRIAAPAPALERIAAKRSGPPPSIPTE